MFIDSAVIEIVAGDGGKGCIAFRREKFNPRGGPSGGTGGTGGSVYFEADQGMFTLMDFRYKMIYKAPRGAHGQGKDCTGRNGEDIVIRVPLGTVITDADTGGLIGDLTFHGQRVLAAKGGRGGRGNACFATPTRRSPEFAEDGKPGESRKVNLELKSIADVGLVGFPNAGKSTLLGRISKANPKIADYPFTTLTPNLGVVSGESGSFVVADIPGLIEGAHSGKGLGLEFLRHIERTHVLVLLIDITAPDPPAQYAILVQELSSYSKVLAAKPRCAVFTKMDLVPESAPLPGLEGQELFLVDGISAVTGRGLDKLMKALAEQVSKARSREDNREVET